MILRCCFCGNAAFFSYTVRVRKISMAGFPVSPKQHQFMTEHNIADLIRTIQVKLQKPF